MALKSIFILLSLTITLNGGTTSIAAVGDIMMGSDYPVSRLPPDTGRTIFDEAIEILKKADLAFGNLEGTLCDGGRCAKDLNKGYYFAFRTPTAFGQNLKNAGFDILNLANNHSRDFGAYGERSTKKVLDSLGISYTDCNGKVAVINRDSIRIAFVGFYYGSCQNSLLDIALASEVVDSLAKLYEIVVVSFHGGREGSGATHVGEGPEYYFGEHRGDLRRFTHAVVDAGADLVLGHGPHVPRGLEIYKGRLIAYSLGNFCTLKGINVKGKCGFAPLLWIDIDSDGGFVSGRIYSFKQEVGTGPKLDVEAETFNLIKNLSFEDFPNSSPVFGEDGVVAPTCTQKDRFFRFILIF